MFKILQNIVKFFKSNSVDRRIEKHFEYYMTDVKTLSELLTAYDNLASKQLDKDREVEKLKTQIQIKNEQKQLYLLQYQNQIATSKHNWNFFQNDLGGRWQNLENRIAILEEAVHCRTRQEPKVNAQVKIPKLKGKNTKKK